MLVWGQWVLCFWALGVGDPVGLRSPGLGAGAHLPDGYWVHELSDDCNTWPRLWTFFSVTSSPNIPLPTAHTIGSCTFLFSVRVSIIFILSCHCSQCFLSLLFHLVESHLLTLWLSSGPFRLWHLLSYFLVWVLHTLQTTYSPLYPVNLLKTRNNSSLLTSWLRSMR